MTAIDKIESLMTDIESSKIPEEEKQQKTKQLTDLWKFISCQEDLELINHNLIAVVNENGITSEIQVECHDLILENNSKTIIEKLFLEIEKELEQLGSKYNGFYTIQFLEANYHFDEKLLINLKSEVISAIKGEVILYQYVFKINKITSEDIQITTRNFKVLECKKETLQERIDELQQDVRQKDFGQKDFGQKWLVLVLSKIDNDCNYFAFADCVFKEILFSGYERIFILDFYAGTTIELQSDLVAVS